MDKCDNCGGYHRDKERESKWADMQVDRLNGLLKSMSPEEVHRCVDTYNANDYLGYIVNSVLYLSNVDMFEPTNDEQEKELMEIRKAIITKLLTEELGEKVFDKEL